MAADELERAGQHVVLTRSDGDYYLTIRTRAEIATALAPDVMVSVHHNSGGPPPSEIPGSEMFFQIGGADSERLAQLLDEEVLAAFTPFDVDWVRGDAGAKYRQGDDGDYFGILRFSKPVTTVLTESAFMSNPSEAEFLATPEAHTAEGAALARGILRFLEGSRSSTTATSSTMDPAGPPTISPPTVPGTLPLYGPAGDAEACVDPDLY